jgi:DNA-binding response OmpR family regulator
MKKQQIFIVDDEPKIVRLLAANLKSIGFETNGYTQGSQAVKDIDLFDPDLILLDIMMPAMDGFAVLERIRSFSNVPVIILTARDQCDDKVHGLNLGADDYLTKPFALDEVFARIKAVLRRSMCNHSVKKSISEIENGSIKINIGQCRVWAEEVEIRLTNTEYKLFLLLMQNIGKVMTHEYLLSEVWGYEYSDQIEYLRVTIARLRQKIKKVSRNVEYIRTYSGIGYMIENQTR